MIWSFLAVLFSGWLYVSASYRGPQWQRYVFKPFTLLLLLVWAWQAQVPKPTNSLILLGLLATLLGDAMMLFFPRCILYAIGSFFLSHLLYTLCFASQITLHFFWPIPFTLLIIGVTLLATVWSYLEELRWPICTFIGMTLLMVWLATEQYFFCPTNYNFTLAAGSVLLLLANIIWLVNHYRFRFKAERAVIAACYFAGHFMIVRSLWLES